MDHYVPPYCPPCEQYWQALLKEGPLSQGTAPAAWEWVEAPAVPMELWEEAYGLHKRHSVLELKIEGFNRGGVIAHWKGIECFVPASHLADYPFPADPVAREGHFQSYVGKTLRLCIIEVEPLRDRILLSERQVPECELAQPVWPDWLCIGSVCSGTITSVRPFGAFVDIGPLEGMVHISEISWGRVRHPQNFLSPGQEVRVKVLNVDPDHQRVGLSLKRLTPNPWDTVQDQFRLGDIVKGTVVSVERFGVFIELSAGIEGLLHVSELSAARSPSQGIDFRSGQHVKVRVLEIAAGEHRIALGLAERPESYATS